MSNGLVVERKGKNSALKVIDPEGQKAGQQLLDSFVEELAINLPKFMDSTPKEKAQTLLQIIGVGDQLAELERQEKKYYDKRHAIGVIADQKEKFAKEKQATLAKDLEIAQKDALDLHDESTAEIEANIASIDETNRKVRANLYKDKAEEDAKQQREEYKVMSNKVEEMRLAQRDLLTNADLPLEGLSVYDGKLLYQDQEWDNMSGSQQLIVATAIIRKLKPDCGFVLIDKLEQMDKQTLEQFGQWLEKEGLQAIATRVSTGDECSIIIEDGYSVKPELIASASDNKGHADTVEPVWSNGF